MFNYVVRVVVAILLSFVMYLPSYAMVDENVVTPTWSYDLCNKRIFCIWNCFGRPWRKSVTWHVFGISFWSQLCSGWQFVITIEGSIFMEQKHKLIAAECRHLLKIINIWNNKFPGSPLPEWIMKRRDKICFQK